MEQVKLEPRSSSYFQLETSPTSTDLVVSSTNESPNSDNNTSLESSQSTAMKSTDSNIAGLDLASNENRPQRQICTLKDHPIHAGCTSVVVVLIGNKVVVANAGDSRCVLSRAGGLAKALSFDHKPSQKREIDRIIAAGGFVNQFGRINGNLNLSRSIGM